MPKKEHPCEKLAENTQRDDDGRMAHWLGCYHMIVANILLVVVGDITYENIEEV